MTKHMGFGEITQAIRVLYIPNTGGALQSTNGFHHAFILCMAI